MNVFFVQNSAFLRGQIKRVGTSLLESMVEDAERTNAGSDLPNVTNAGELTMYETRRLWCFCVFHAVASAMKKD